MAIYNEETDANENAGLEMTEKEFLIDEINDIIKKHGEFTVADVEADHSPFIETKGKLTHLMEEFREGDGSVRVYDPTSYSSDEIDEYDEVYEEVDISQLEYILQLAQEWAEIKEEEEEEEE